MKDRIKELRKSLKLTQQAFGDRLGIKQNTVALYEMGRSGVSDGIINSICREFNVNETWLRTGEGQMFRERSMEDALTDFMKDLSFEGDESFKKRFIQAIAQMSDEGWKNFEKWLNEFLLNYQKPAAGDLDPNQEAEAYRKELIIQKKAAERLKASDGTEERKEA